MGLLTHSLEGVVRIEGKLQGELLESAGAREGGGATPLVNRETVEAVP